MTQEDIKKAREVIEDTISIGKIGIRLLSEEGKKNRLKYREALETALKALDLVPELVEALELIIPLAKGYVAHNEVGSNRKYLNIAEQVLSKYKEVK